MNKRYDVVIVGAGFFGCTLAERFANEKKTVLLLEKRSHIGGNAYSYFDESTKIEVHKYGSHIFHTNSLKIWEYITQFATFNTYIHRVKSKTNLGLIPIPINLETINLAFDMNFDSQSAREFLATQKISQENRSENLEDWAQAEIGEKLYKLLIQGYTTKQWGISPKDLPSSIIARLPIRFDYDDRYFTDKYQGMPVGGYESIFSNMLKSDLIDVQLDTDYFYVRDKFESNQLTVYSGPIDRFFDYREGILGWRTLDFEIEKLEIAQFQNNAVVNYPDINVPFTRIHEFKHFYPERMHSNGATIISREFSRVANESDEPYYPIGTEKDKVTFAVYKEYAEKMERVYIGGRLGSYQYLDMHMAINQALITFDEIMERWFAS